MDSFSKEKRSEIMSHIRSKGNKSTELKLIALFRANRIRGGGAIPRYSAIPILFFRNTKYVLLWTVAFGMAASCAQLEGSQNQTGNIGRQK